jgi:hypothetical protein
VRPLFEHEQALLLLLDAYVLVEFGLNAEEVLAALYVLSSTSSGFVSFGPPSLPFVRVIYFKLERSGFEFNAPDFLEIRILVPSSKPYLIQVGTACLGSMSDTLETCKETLSERSCDDASSPHRPLSCT